MENEKSMKNRKSEISSKVELKKRPPRVQIPPPGQEFIGHLKRYKRSIVELR